MNYRSIVRFASAAVLTLSAAQVFAGDFFEEKGVALSSYDAISYFTPSPDPILGVKELSYDYKAHPRVFALVDGKLYLFSDLESRKNWKKDVAGNIARATEQWSQVSKLVAQNR